MFQDAPLSIIQVVLLVFSSLDKSKKNSEFLDSLTSAVETWVLFILGQYFCVQIYLTCSIVF